MHEATHRNNPTLAVGCHAVPWTLVAPTSSNLGRLTRATCGIAEIRSHRRRPSRIGTVEGPHFFFWLPREMYSSCLHSHVMFSLHAARHCHSFARLPRSLTSLRTPAIRQASTKTLLVRPRPQSIVQQCLPAMRRSASTQSQMSAAAKASLNRSMSGYEHRAVEIMLTVSQ